MRKFIVGCVSVLVALSLCSCSAFIDGIKEGAEGSSGDSSESSTTTTAAAKADSDDKTKDTEGDIGDYHVKIVSAKKGKDYAKKDVLIITYQWKNNSDKEQMFSTALSAKAYQNGVECSTTTIVDGVDAQKLLANIKPGATLELQKPYLLSDSSDVNVEVGPWIDLGNGAKVTKTFSVK